MAAADTVKRYFEAMGAQDLDAAVALWEPGGVERIVGGPELIAPQGIRQYFGELFAAFPDFGFEVLEAAAGEDRVAVRWRARGPFAGPGRFQGFEPNGARVEIEGCDVVTVADGRISHNDAYLDSGDVARQLGFLPATGSSAEAKLIKLANLGTKVRGRMEASEPERVAEGVWVLRGGFPLRTMNVYLIEDAGGVTVFDAGIEDMTRAIRVAAVRMGGIKRVVLGHADADHRGAAPGLGAPVYCHPAEREAAESPDSCRTYWNLDKLDPHGRVLLSKLIPVWDGGAVQIADTVREGDEVAGFEVIELPGHAPGLIGLFRSSDRVALVSDCFYTLDPQTGRKRPAQIPHPAFNADTEQVRESIRKLATREPSVAWAGHADPVRDDVVSRLYRAAETM